MSHQFWWWILWTFWWQLWWLWQNGWISGKTKVSPSPATPAPGEASAPHQQYHPPLRHPPHLLLSPSPSSGRRRVMSVGRPSRWPTPLGTWQPQPGRPTPIPTLLPTTSATTPLSTSFFKAFGKDSSSSTLGQLDSVWRNGRGSRQLGRTVPGEQLQKEVGVIVTIDWLRLLFVMFICLPTFTFGLGFRPLRLLRPRVRGVLGDGLGRGVASPWQKAWGVQETTLLSSRKACLVLYMGE